MTKNVVKERYIRLFCRRMEIVTVRNATAENKLQGTYLYIIEYIIEKCSTLLWQFYDYLIILKQLKNEYNKRCKNQIL